MKEGGDCGLGEDGVHKLRGRERRPSPWIGRKGRNMGEDLLEEETEGRRG